MARDKWIYGKSVVDGRVRFLAPTTIQKADPNDPGGGGCLRRWFYEKVMGFKPDDEEKPWLDLGKQCHGEVEHLIKTGENVLGRITSSTRRFAEPFIGRPVLVEYDIGGGNPDLSLATLTAAGIPIVGYVDIISDLPALGEDGELTDDPPGTIEELDWKFGGAKKGADRGDFSKSGSDLLIDTQMIASAEWISRKLERAGKPAWHHRLSHVYTNTKGRSESSKATVRVDREHIARRWEYVDAVARTIADVARETSPDRVPANTNACGSFGGCPFAKPGVCSAFDFNSLDSFFGGTGSMGLMDSLNLGGVTPPAPAAPAPVAPPVVAASPAGVHATIPGHDIASQMAALMGGAPAAAAPAFTVEFANAVDEIAAKGYGFPPLAGDAAKAFAHLMRSRGHNVPDAPAYPGAGELGQIAAAQDQARVVGMAAELRPLPVKGTAPVVAPPPAAPAVVVSQAPGLLSAESPISGTFSPTALPIEGFGAPTPANPGTTPGVGVPGLIASVPASVAAPIIAAGATSAPPALPDVAPVAPRTRKPRTKKPDTAPAGASADAVATAGEDPAWLFVDCRPNIAHDDLQEHITTWLVGMAKHYKCDPLDVRCASKEETRLAFGAWKGAVQAVAAAAAKHLAAGAWYLDTRGSETNEAVLEGLRASGVFEMIVRGVR